MNRQIILNFSIAGLPLVARRYFPTAQCAQILCILAIVRYRYNLQEFRPNQMKKGDFLGKSLHYVFANFPRHGQIFPRQSGSRPVAPSEKAPFNPKGGRRGQLCAYLITIFLPSFT